MTTSSPTTTPTSGLVFRPAAERFHSQLDWLDSWHSFSFSSHFDPAWLGFGPLLVINDDTIAAGRGFGHASPSRYGDRHRDGGWGSCNHRDSMGNAGVLLPGEVQRMSAGTGVVHSEINEGDQPCRLLQLWIEPSSTGIAPTYEQKPFAIGPGWTPLLDPERRDGRHGHPSARSPLAGSASSRGAPEPGHRPRKPGLDPADQRHGRRQRPGKPPSAAAG